MSRADDLRAQLAAVEAEEEAEATLNAAVEAYRANLDDPAAKAAATEAAQALRAVRAETRADRGLSASVAPDAVAAVAGAPTPGV